MKITIEHYDNIHKVEMPDDTLSGDLMDKLKGMVIFIGYHNNSIEEWILEEADLIERDK